jgi:SAM-dependent methyltransferase
MSAASLERVNEYYQRAMDGHVFIRSTFEAFLAAVGRRVKAHGPKSRVLELGSHAGFVTAALLQRWPELEIVVSDDDQELVSLSRLRLCERSVRYHVEPLENLDEQFDLVLSVAKHHHLPHGYLPAVRRNLKPNGAYLLADELCPEYCDAEQTARIEAASVLRIAGGYVFTSDADFERYERDGLVPAYAEALEARRRRALWRWYRFVVDVAVEQGYFDIAAGELQSARDDLVTGSRAEHKFSPAIVEREFALAGFRLLDKCAIGTTGDAERQSMFVYEYAPT